jgi:hypothetical protein
MDLEYFINEYRILMQEALKKLERTSKLCLLLGCCFFYLIFNPENGSHMLFRNAVDFHRTTWRYIPEDGPLPYMCLFTQAYCIPCPFHHSSPWWCVMKLHIWHITHQVGARDKATDFYTRGARFKSQPEQISLLRFLMVFVSLSMRMHW